MSRQPGLPSCTATLTLLPVDHGPYNNEYLGSSGQVNR